MTSKLSPPYKPVMINFIFTTTNENKKSFMPVIIKKENRKGGEVDERIERE
jgi:hypothetical protein